MVFRRGRSLSPISKIKHVIDTEGVLTAATQVGIPIADTVIVPNATFAPVEVPLGDTINGFYITLFMIGASGVGANGSLAWILYKERSGQAALAPTPNNVGVSTIRNQVIHQEKGLAGSQDGTPMAFKGVVVVPKAYRRAREGDRWFIRILNTDATNDVNFCVQVHYNSYS